MFKWAEDRGDIPRSPLEGMTAPGGVASRDRVLSDLELRAIWKASESLGYPFGPIIRLLIATGQRREEVAALRWEEIDRKQAVWTLPAVRAKNGIAHVVPLSTLTMYLINELAIEAASVECGPLQSWPPAGYLFTTTGTTAVSGHSKAKSRLDLLLSQQAVSSDGVADAYQVITSAWRVHDIRRSFATGMQRLGVRFEVTEAVLNHVSGSKSGVAGIYQRHDWKDEKREALELWSEHLRSLHL